MASESLRITEIFYSLQGESNTSGLPTVFVRLTGCPLRCTWCDTEYSFSGGERMTIDAIVQQVADYGADYVCVTGGEPLAQPGCLPLLERLADAGYEVSLETSGALDVAAVDSRVVKVMDLKAPGSGEVGKNLYQNIHHLDHKDQVKFVIADRADYDWSASKLIEYNLTEKVSDVLFSPVSTGVEPAELAHWILADRLPVRFQIQLHRVIWGDKTGV
ncbi:7-carboxy-7-deazaguanine synthase [Endozoicomonas montiporae]|uniref:7-carboxy-7-deazaguanine synthase n=2 Tax=Endozoicomonas montiporae TaxID=1027273 RepID=A0A081N9X6_9GAMM|nr:7-carboxy-7-deazaguanine synthase QueE [Endozoicomonas montiporae]AMO57085.1 7-carboxy-7-deazaguanine synthase [Endozoicomonas montiporae CL-33]KEQ15249.1 7-carboxy-7-deazaguanine synthase [Endozoicomonas montiporae]